MEHLEYVDCAVIVKVACLIIVIIVFDLHGATKVIFCIEAEGCGLVQDIVWITQLMIGLWTSSNQAFGVAIPVRLYKTAANRLSRNDVIVCSIWALAPIKTGIFSDCSFIFKIVH